MSPAMKRCLVLLLLAYVASGQPSIKPVDFALKAMEAILHERDHFMEWFYGGAIIMEGLFRVDRVFAIDMSHVTNAYLDTYKTDPQAYGYKILHQQQIPFFHNVGDQVPLFSSVYLLRAENSSGSPGYPDSEKAEDVIIATAGAYNYVLKFPLHLPDGTPTRGYGWKTERNASTFLWCDDMYMGLTPLVRAAVYHQDTGAVVLAARWAVMYAHYLMDPADKLYLHGANTEDSHQSCCKWGRANGWALMAKVEVLEAMEKIPGLTGMYEYYALRELFVSHVRAIVGFQVAGDGRWRQLVNDSSSFLETSSTSMFLSSLCRGVINTWIEAAEFGKSIEAAWVGLVKTLNEDGSIAGVCDGEGIEIDASIYKNCSTSYLSSGNGGVGAVFYAVTDYQRYRNHRAGFPLEMRQPRYNRSTGE